MDEDPVMGMAGPNVASANHVPNDNAPKEISSSLS